jgi:hypothetical protein
MIQLTHHYIGVFCDVNKYTNIMLKPSKDCKQAQGVRADEKGYEEKYLNFSI